MMNLVLKMMKFIFKMTNLLFNSDILLVFSAPGGAQELYSVTPDLACVAKIVAGGMAGIISTCVK